jgi:hypothetical protein
MANPFLYPQYSTSPIAAGTLRDEQEAIKTAEGDATANQRALSIGSAVPIVFGKFANRKGGVWANPVAGRMGLQLSDTQDNHFSFGMVVSDGKISPIADDDIYKGTFPMSALKEPVAVNAYGYMPEDGFDYSFSSTITTPGQEGTPDETEERDVESGVNISGTVTLNQYADPNFYTVLSVSSANSINVTFSQSLSSYAIDYKILRNGSLVATGFLSGAGINFSDSSNENATYTFQYRNGNSAIQYQRCTFKVNGVKTTRTTVVIPGDPEIPPIYTTTGLPLFPGEGGSYAGMSCLAVRGAYEAGGEMDGYREQIRCFVRNGIEVQNIATGATQSSDNFIDLAYYLLKKNKVSDQLIDLQGFRDAHQFLDANDLHFNGTISASVNLRSYFEAVAPGMMLKFIQNNGRFSFKPVLPIGSDNTFKTGTINPVKTFTNDNVNNQGFGIRYYESRLRKPFCVLLSWREQFSQKYSRVVQEEIRYPGIAIDGPFEPYDYSEFITSTEHANLVGRYILSTRARITHEVKFQTYLDMPSDGEKAAGQLAPMDIINVDVTGLNQFGELRQNGVYQVSSVAENANGSLDIEAVYFPVDDGGASLIVADILS